MHPVPPVSCAVVLVCSLPRSMRGGTWRTLNIGLACRAPGRQVDAKRRAAGSERPTSTPEQPMTRSKTPDDRDRVPQAPGHRRSARRPAGCWPTAASHQRQSAALVTPCCTACGTSPPPPGRAGRRSGHAHARRRRVGGAVRHRRPRRVRRRGLGYRLVTEVADALRVEGARPPRRQVRRPPGPAAALLAGPASWPPSMLTGSPPGRTWAGSTWRFEAAGRPGGGPGWRPHDLPAAWRPAAWPPRSRWRRRPRPRRLVAARRRAGSRP